MDADTRLVELALPWAAAMPDDDLHHFLGDLVAAAMHRWHQDPDVPDREVLALVERACAQWRTPGQGWRSDSDDVAAGETDTRLAEIRSLDLLRLLGDNQPASAQLSGHLAYLLGELAEARAKLEIAERQAADLDAKLAERTRQLDGLLAVLDFDEKAVPA